MKIKVKNLEDQFLQLKISLKGEKFTKNNIKKIRPGNGLSPIYYNKILNKNSPMKIYKGEPLTKKKLKGIKIKFS